MTWKGCHMWCERADGFCCGDDYCDIEIGLVPEPQDCARCAGNGEIVTDWPTYLHPPEGAPADAGTADCPDCGGTGTVSS
jgi:hypothetical protein